MKILQFKILASAILLAYGCSDNDNLKLNSNYPNELINAWVESYEEGNGIYRPSDYTNFPISRFRQAYKFMEMNKCEYLVLSPLDAHYIENGLWEYDDQYQILRIYKLNEELLRELKVISISTELLQIE